MNLTRKPELCVECQARPEYAAFKDLALGLDEELRATFGREDVPSGATLFLGRHYAHSRTILFTLNPTPYAAHRPRAPVDTQLFKVGIHWEGARPARFRNWTGGRHLFNAMVGRAPWFKPELEKATDAFIVPWSSRDWRSMLRSKGWPSIRDHSRTVFWRNLENHGPNLIFTSGKFVNQLLWSFLEIPKPKSVEVWQSPTSRNWDAEWFQVNEVLVATTTIPELNVFRLPHFSRFNRKQFAAIGEWVACRLPR